MPSAIGHPVLLLRLLLQEDVVKATKEISNKAKIIFFIFI
jgi:hypothetical protein